MVNTAINTSHAQRGEITNKRLTRTRTCIYFNSLVRITTRAYVYKHAHPLTLRFPNRTLIGFVSNLAHGYALGKKTYGNEGASSKANMAAKLKWDGDGGMKVDSKGKVGGSVYFGRFVLLV